MILYSASFNFSRDKKARRLFTVIIPLIFVNLIFTNCASKPADAGFQAAPKEWTFEDAAAFTWRLAAIKIGNGSIYLDRTAMRNSGENDFYTLRFTEQGFSGHAVINDYFAPFTRHPGNVIAISQIAGTRNENLAEVNVAGLGEEEYYWYLERAARWEIVNERLLLYCGPEKLDITMHFVK